MSEYADRPPIDELLPALDSGEDVWASVSLPQVTLLATDRRLLSRQGERIVVWDYRDIRQVGPAGIEGDVVIAFRDGQRPLVLHARGNDAAMQALTVIGLLVAQSRRVLASVGGGDRRRGVIAQTGLHQS